MVKLEPAGTNRFKIEKVAQPTHKTIRTFVRMMKFVACATLVVAAFAAVEATKILEREGHQNNMIERLGHFNQKPFIDLYKFYAAAFVLPKHPGRAKDDYRNYMPSGDECMIFFKKFRIDQYKLRDLDDFIVLDACLGYMYANENQEIDIETSHQVKELLSQLQADEQLKSLFDGTQINEQNDQAKECIANLLMNTVVAKHQYPDVVCNNHFLQVFLQFAECQANGVISAESRSSDTYLSTLYDLLKERVGVCVDHEIGHIEAAVRLAYKHAGGRRLVNKIKSPFSSMNKQANERMWPQQVVTLLAAVQNTTDEVNQREVHQLIRGVIVNDVQLKDRLLSHLAYYADKRIAPATHTKAEAADPDGILRYNSLIDKLCNYFRSSDQESEYDFATPIIRLVQLLAYEDLFGITQKDFVKKILVHAKETSPIYLSVQACNILTYTEGVLGMPVKNAKQHYRVAFKQDTKGMVLWPDAGYF